jgi:glycosyl transferase family 25
MMPYEIIEAVDGRDLGPEDGSAIGPEIADMANFEPGVAGPGFKPRACDVGCALSHLRAYQKMLDDGGRVALVLEDDTLLPSDLAKLVDDVAGHMTGADVVLLNFAAPEECRLSTEGSVPLPSSRALVFPVDLSQVTCGAGYLITSEACERMVRGLMPVQAHCDDWGHFWREGLLDRVRCVSPLPVRQDPTFRTTVDAFAAGSLQLRVREAIVRHRIPPFYQARILRKRLRRGHWSNFELVPEPPDQLRKHVATAHFDGSEESTP